jgi:hypothetical protein
LIEIVGAGEMHISANEHFIAIADSFNAKDDHGYMFAGALADTKRGKNNFAQRPRQTD